MTPTNDPIAWPDFWPPQPTVDDAAGAAARHASEVVRWWQDANPLRTAEGRESYAAKSPVVRHRLLVFGDDMWVLGDVSPALRPLARDTTWLIVNAEYDAAVARLTNLAMPSAPESVRWR